MGCDLFFFFNDTATTEIYTLSLHDALPISVRPGVEDSTRNSAGDPSRSAPTTNSSASAPRGTADFTPLSTKPSPSGTAFVVGLSTSNSTVGSLSASAAAGTSSPVHAGR